ncbi:MAG: hypothetical protein ACTHM6_11895 [Tepidisphaeraceae bacterium]
MFEDFRKIIEEIQKLPDPAKSTAQVAFVAWCAAKIVYYAVAGLVVWALGRRLIQASFAAMREARRSND